MTRYLVLALMTCTLVARGQDRKPVAPPPPTPVADKDVQIKLLRAQRDLRSAQADMANLESQFQSLQSQMNNLRAQAPAAQGKVGAAQAVLDKEVAEAAKSIGLDPAKYDLDHDKLVFSPKVAPAPSTPSPDKK